MLDHDVCAVACHTACLSPALSFPPSRPSQDCTGYVLTLTALAFYLSQGLSVTAVTRVPKFSASN